MSHSPDFGSFLSHNVPNDCWKRSSIIDSSFNLSTYSSPGASVTSADCDSPMECFSPLPSTSPSTDCLKQQATAVSPVSSGVFETSRSYLEHFTREELIRVITLHVEQHTRNDSTAPHTSESSSIFFNVSPPTISTLSYIRRIVTHTHCSPSAFIVALIFLERIAQRHHDLRLSRLNLHRLVITAVTLAAKKLDDRSFPIAHYVKVGGVPSKAEMIRLEITFMRLIDFDLHVTYLPYTEMLGRLNTLLDVTTVNTSEQTESLISPSTSLSKERRPRQNTVEENSSPLESMSSEGAAPCLNAEVEMDGIIIRPSEVPRKTTSSACSSLQTSNRKRPRANSRTVKCARRLENRRSFDDDSACDSTMLSYR